MAKLKFKRDAKLDVIEYIVAEDDDNFESSFVKYNKGDIIDVDIIDDYEQSLYFQLQFSDGSVISSVSKTLFEILEEN
jgi:hypothetical protein